MLDKKQKMNDGRQWIKISTNANVSIFYFVFKKNFKYSLEFDENVYFQLKVGKQLRVTLKIVPNVATCCILAEISTILKRSK